MATSLPRTSRIAFLLSFSRSRRSKIASPETTFPGGCGISPSSVMVLTLLPEPDSPTIPSTSPGKTS